MAIVSLDILISRSIDNMGTGIHPVVKESAVELIKRAYKEKIYVQITSGYRGMEEQAKLYGQGRKNYVYNGKQYADPSKNIVTNAQPGESNHNFGLAIDYVIVSDDGRSAIWTVTDKWRRAAAIGISLGFAWGGNWTGNFKDYPHLEMMGGLSIKQLRNGEKPNLISKVPASRPAKTSASRGSIKKPSSPTPAKTDAKTAEKLVFKKILRPGDTGNDVKTLQLALNRVKFNCGTPDGVYGKATQNAVHRFQEVYLPGEVDGIAGKNTITKLNSLLNK